MFPSLYATQQYATQTLVLGPRPWPRGLFHPIRSSGRRGWRGPVSDAMGRVPIRSWPVDGGWARLGSPVDGGGRVRNPRRPSSRGSRGPAPAQPNPNHPAPIMLPRLDALDGRQGPGRRPGAECPAARRWRWQRTTVGAGREGGPQRPRGNQNGPFPQGEDRPTQLDKIKNFHLEVRLGPVVRPSP